MKKILISLLLIACTLGCDQDFLEKQPLETASLETLFATAGDLELAVNGIYDVFQGSIWGGSFYHITPHWDGVTEDAIFCCSWEGQYQPIAQGNVTSSSGGIIDFKWNFGYRGISRANAVLANIDRSDLQISEDVRTRFKGEVKFLRALMYFELSTHYGGVPLILSPVNRDQSMAPRNKREEVIAAVIDDLNFAIDALTTEPLNGQTGRPTKQSALGLKTRVLLYEKNWQGAASAAQAVMDLEAQGVTGLSDNYEALFNGTAKADKEVLFDIQYKAPAVGEGNYLSDHYGPSSVDNGAGWGSVSYQETMFDAFYMTDGLPKDQSSLYNPNDPYANRDKRLYWSFFVPGFSTWQGKPYTEQNYAGLIPSLPLNTKKWVTESDVNWAQDGNSNFIILRYADVLLMYAEAKNELSGPDQSVHNAINKVRTRAGMPNLAAGLSQEQMRQAIRHERKVELSQEGLRYFDLVRWGIAAEKINANKREQRNWKPGYLPIPQRELDANPNLDPNG